MTSLSACGSSEGQSFTVTEGLGGENGTSSSGGVAPAGGNLSVESRGGATAFGGNVTRGGATASGGSWTSSGGNGAAGTSTRTLGGGPSFGGQEGASSGGANASGGASSGGANASGGASSGGANASGGASSGGANASGGAPSGGANASGGASNGGANASGGASSGGANASGGASSGTGGDGNDTEMSDGCNQDPSLTSGERELQTSGKTRNYILRIPDGYDKNHPYRVVFGFHWRGGTMQDVDSGGSDKEQWSYYGLRQQAENSTIFVAPQGLGSGWGNSNGEDVVFVDDMLKEIESDLCIDKSRVFAVGFSWGGGMSYSLACSRANVFRAVAVYAGGVLSGCEDGTKPVAYLGIHGVSDGTCGIAGGRGLRDKFVTNNGCTPQNPSEPNPGSGTHICTSYDGCSSGHPVRWCAFDGDHTPGHVEGGGDSGARTWTKGEVWEFFTQF